MSQTKLMLLGNWSITFSILHAMSLVIIAIVVKTFCKSRCTAELGGSNPLLAPSTSKTVSSCTDNDGTLI